MKSREFKEQKQCRVVGRGRPLVLGIGHRAGPVCFKRRFDGLLKFYYRDAA
jgi:hypothetical protein